MADNSPRLELPLLHAGQAHKEITHNMALLRVDALLHGAVLSDSCVAPPEAPQAGQCWIIPERGDAWGRPAGMIAAYTGQGWMFITPRAGMWLWVHSRAQFCWHDGTNWVATGLPWVLPVSFKALAQGPQGQLWNAPVTGEMIDSAAREMISKLVDLLKANEMIRE